METQVIHRGIRMPAEFVEAWDRMLAFAEEIKRNPIPDDSEVR